MFKKLKDKIAEEVKQSPLKSVQQLAQAVVSPSSSSVFEPSSSNDKFCIEEGDIEEDEKQDQAKPGGFTSVALTGQTTSPIRDQNQRYGFRSSPGSLMADADNLFPKFEPQPTNFHVQSDWESASEVEDRYSQLEHINKESLYEAYRKVYNRYNKMKNKYHEVVTHYRQLEREKEKAKTVLTETQDKALLRISELREQCLLEQQAKAHLEEALRNELEERDHIINTLKTKVQYLKGVGDTSTTESLDTSHLSKEEGNLIDFTENQSVSTVPLPFDASSSKEHIYWFEEKLKTLKNLLNEETAKVDQLKSKLQETRKQSHDSKDSNLESVDDLEQRSEKELSKTLSDLICKVITEVHYMHKNAVHCSLLKSVSEKENLELKLTEDSNEFVDSKTVYDVQNEEMNRHIASIKQLEEQNKILSQKLQEEHITAKDLENKFRGLSTVTDLLTKKIKLSNENFGKNDAINCLITDTENDLIQEWNLCFENFLQTRCQIAVLKDSREDLEKELLRIKEEKNKLENMNKKIVEHDNELKGAIEVLQKELKSYLDQLENTTKEKSVLKDSNKNLEIQVKKLEKTLEDSEKIYCEKQEDVQNVISEKNAIETKLSSLEFDLKKANSEYTLILEANKNLNVELSSLKKENCEVSIENEALNKNIIEVKNKLKQVEDDYKTVTDTRDGLNDQINSLTKENEELVSEKNALLTKISDLEKDLENTKLGKSLVLKEKEKILKEFESIKDKYELANKEKISITEKFQGLVNELENNKHNYSKAAESAQQQSDELVSLREENNKVIKEKCSLESKIENLNEDLKVQLRLSEELLSVKEERDNLVSEIQLIQNKIVELDAISKAASEEISLIKKNNAELTSEKINMQKEIQRLEECLRLSEEKNSSSSEVNMKLSEELCSLKKERDSLISEKSALEDQSNQLQDYLSTSREELSRLLVEYNKMSDKLQILQGEHMELVSKKQVEQGCMEEMKNKLKEKEERLLLVNEKNSALSDEIETLKNDFGQVEKDYKLLQNRYNSGIAEYENNKEFTISLSTIKEKLSDEVDSLKKDCAGATYMLNKTKAQLEKQQNTNSELEDQLHSLSESLKNKSDETNKICQENMNLKTEIKNLMEKVNVSNCYIDKLTKEKDFILNYLIANLKNVKIIKELQKNLYDFVKQFQVEMSQEINHINLKMGHDLLKHLNDLMEPESCGTKFIELECRSKKDRDSYNSKLKNLQGSSHTSEQILQVKTTDLESSNNVENELNSKTVKFKRMGQLEKLVAEVDDCISFDQNVYDPEVYLKQAVLLMKSFTNLLNHNSVGNDYLMNDLFVENLNKEKCIKLNEIEGKNLQQEIVAMESFITDYEKEATRVRHHKMNETDNNACEHGGSSDMQLRQELRLKEDIVKKLQSVIEDYEQENGGDEKESYNRQKILILEKENKSLLQKLEQLQETHELNVKNLISEYEKKLEEIEEDKNLYDFEKLDKEKKYVVNEMKEQIENLQQDLEERGDAFEKLYEEHQHSVKNIDDEIQQLRNNHEKELREQDKKWRQCLDRRLAEEEARYQQQLSSLNMQWNAERRELETARRLAVNAVESSSGSNELLRRQVQALTVQLTELRNNKCEACDRKRRKDSGEETKPRSIQDCTEMEYLRNILYEYMMGKEPLVLAKVLCALVKFDENQTKEIVSKEEHRITLFGQLGLL